MKKILLLVFASLFMIVFVKQSYAVKWVPVGTNEADSVVFYVDVDSMHRSGNLVQMWILSDYNSPLRLPNGSSYLSILDFYTFNCPSRLFSSGKQIHYPEKRAAGNAVRTINTVDPFQSPIPGSVQEGMYKFACSNNK